MCVIGNAVPMTYIYKKEMDFDNVLVANPAPAMNIARRGEADQAAIGAVNEELNFPSLQILRRILVIWNPPSIKNSSEYLQTWKT